MPSPESTTAYQPNHHSPESTPRGQSSLETEDQLLEEPVIQSVTSEQLRQEFRGMQGQSLTRQFVTDHFDDLKHRVEIDNWVFVLPDIGSPQSDHRSIGTTYVVYDKAHPEELFSRAVMASRSDGPQFKLVNGRRADGSYKKGQELIRTNGRVEHNRHNHYVQSNKLDPRFYNVLARLQAQADPQSPAINYDAYLPRDGSKTENQDAYVEQYVQLQNPDWRTAQRHYQTAYQLLSKLVHHNMNPRDMTPQGEYYAVVKAIANTPSAPDKQHLTDRAAQMAQLIETMSGQPQLLNQLQRFNLQTERSTQDPLDQLRQAAIQTSGLLLENSLSRPLPDSMTPDFNQPPVQKYRKPNPHNPQQYIDIQEYQVVSPQGDCLRWAMAHDSQGRYYIDNVYDPRVGLNSYGAPSQIVSAGLLVYKPEDYDQATVGILPKYKHKTPSQKYTDISQMWLNNPMIAAYKQARENSPGIDLQPKTEPSASPEPPRIQPALSPQTVHRQFSSRRRQPKR